jgi:hypothetical protein
MKPYPHSHNLPKQKKHIVDVEDIDHSRAPSTLMILFSHKKYLAIICKPTT